MKKSVRPALFAFVIIMVLLSGCDSSSNPIQAKNKSILIETSVPTNNPVQTNTSIPPSATIIYSATPTSTKLSPTLTLTSSVTPTPTKLPPTATLAPSETPFPQASSTSLEAVTVTASPSDFTILALTSPVFVGSNVTLRIQTLASSSCDLSYKTPSGTDSEAKGLGETTADAKGVCSWTWKIGPKTKPGTGSLTITANDTTEYLDIVIQ